MNEINEIDEVRRRFGDLKFYRLCPEWCSSGVWLPKALGNIPVGPCLSLDKLPVSKALKDRIVHWQAVFDEQVPERAWSTPGGHSSFSAEGLNIAMDLSREMGVGALIEYGIGSWFVLFQAGSCVASYAPDERTSALRVRK